MKEAILNNKALFLKAEDRAKELIEKARPSLCISAYHRSEDLILIPQSVLKLRPDYKIYLRHFPSLPCWDMSYYFI